VSRRDRRRFLLWFGALLAALFVAGIVVAGLRRHDTICSNGKAPVAQRDQGLGQVAYRCSDGEVVTK
jgi:hypothetical protein